MRAILSGLTFVILAACSAEAPLVDRHVEALGGEAALESIDAILIELDISEPGFSVTGRYIARRNGDVRVDIFDDDVRVFSEGISDTEGWQMFGDGRIAPTSEAGTGALRRGVERNLFGLHEFESRNHSVSVGDPEIIDGISYPVLNIVMSDGFEERVYLDQETLLPARIRSEYALHPDIDPEIDRHETLYSDYRSVDGVMRSFLQETIDLRDGETVQTVRIRSVDINPDLEPGIFDRPGGE